MIEATLLNSEVFRKLNEISKNCKYTLWYCNIVLKGINRQEQIAGEKHHIIPRSLWKEGLTLKDNIVKLTYKEHFICHKLLPLMLKDKKDVNKMIFALTRMSRIYIKNKNKLIGANEFRKIKEDFLEVNRQKTLNEMKDVERKENFIKAGQKALKELRDKDPVLWTEKSCNRIDVKIGKKITHQSESHREKCRQRELAKPLQERILNAKNAQQALVEKLGGYDEYVKYLSSRIKGRKKYINPITKDVRVLKDPLEGFVLITEYNKKIS